MRRVSTNDRGLAAHERHGELKEWLGDDVDPERFELDAVIAALDEVSRN